MTTIRLVASLALGLAIATPAIAAEPDTVAPVTAAASAASAGTATTATSVLPAAKTRYCVQLDLTGTRINRFRCETRRNWQAMGVDIDAMLKNNRR